MINLLGNAVKFTESGGVELKAITQPDGHYLFEILDTGPGIPTEPQDAIFAPFEQKEEGLEQGGTGLGLAIARRHVELMNGQLEVESTLGHGARFFFAVELPPAQSESTDKPNQRRSQVTHLAPGFPVRALVVDALDQDREILAQMLQHIGVDVRLGKNGIQALEYVRENPPDIVFTDTHMPDMKGIEVMRHIREECEAKSPKIIATSASALIHERRNYLESGFDDFVDKPLRLERVYACLAELLEVEYEYLQLEPTDDAGDSTPNLDAIALPHALLDGLREAVKMHSMSDLRSQLETVEALNAGGRTWRITCAS